MSSTDTSKQSDPSAAGGTVRDRPAGGNRARRAVVEFIQFQYTSGHLALIRYVKSLPRDLRMLTRLGLLLVGILILATPLLANAASWLGGVQFLDVGQQPRTVSVAALLLAVAAFSAAWGYLLAALARGPAVIWIIGALRYAFGMLAVGLAAGRSSWHIVPLTVPVLIGAMSSASGPSERRAPAWGNIVVAVLVAGVAVRYGTMPDAVRERWYLYCLPVAVPIVLVHAAVARWVRVGIHVQALFGALVTAGMLAWTWSAVGAGQFTHWFHISLDNLTYWLQVVWFLLGAVFVAGAIEVGQFAKKLVGLVAPEPVPLWTLLIAWAAAAAWIGVPAAPHQARTIAITVLAIATVVLAGRWWRYGMTREWLASWLVASLAALVIAKALYGGDVANAITRDAGTLGIIGFIYAVLWDVTGRIPSVPLETSWFRRPAPLVLYLGLILLTSAATLFGIAANLGFFQQVVATSQYYGAMMLWIPMVGLLVAKSWQRVPAGAIDRFVSAFVIALLAGVPFFLARAAGLPVSDGWYDATTLFVIVALVRASPDAADPVVAGGIGAAAAFGAAVHLLTGMPTLLLNGLFITLGSLFGVPQFLSIAEAVWKVAGNRAPDAQELVVYFWVSPLATAAVAVAAGRILWRQRRERPVAASADGAGGV